MHVGANWLTGVAISIVVAEIMFFSSAPDRYASVLSNATRKTCENHSGTSVVADDAVLYDQCAVVRLRDPAGAVLSVLKVSSERV